MNLRELAYVATRQIREDPDNTYGNRPVQPHEVAAWLGWGRNYSDEDPVSDLDAAYYLNTLDNP